jgi:hypothetical protein
MFFGSSIMSFALPYGAFIVVASALFVLFRAKHSGPRLKYLSPAVVTSVITREPGPVPAPAATTEAPAKEAPGDDAPGGPEGTASGGPEGPAPEGTEGTE